MKLKTTLFGNVYQFKDVKEVLAKANELRSGDVLAGVAAASSQERVAAKQVLSEMTVADIRNNPVIAYEDDCVTRLIQDDVNETAYNQIKNWSISELREYVLSDETSVDDIAFTRKGLTSEVVAAVAKICSNADLIYGAKKMPVIKKANTTIGIPGTFSARLQPNDTRDDVQSIAAQIYEGLSFGVGDAVIGVNPVTDDVENLSRVLDTIYGVIDKFNIPTQGCVLAHVTTQIEAIRRGAPGGLIFQSICGSEKGLKEFGVELAMLDEARAELGKLDSAVAGGVRQEAVCRHAGDGVRLKNDRLAGRGDDEVAPRAPAAAQRAVGAHGELLGAGVDARLKARGDDVVERGGLVLDLEVIELGARHDLHDGEGVGILVAHHGHGYLGSLDALLNEDAPAGGARRGDGAVERGAVRHAGDAEARAVCRRLHEERKAEVLDDLIDLVLA